MPKMVRGRFIAEGSTPPLASSKNGDGQPAHVLGTLEDHVWISTPSLQSGKGPFASSVPQFVWQPEPVKLNAAYPSPEY